MKTTSVGKFQQQIMISDLVATKWGYYLDNPDNHTRFSSTNGFNENKPSKQLMINKHITPIDLANKNHKLSSKHKEILKQIQDYEFKKKMLELQAKRNKKNKGKKIHNSTVTQQLNDRIKQYNHIIDHKHITHKNSQDTKKALNIKPKSQAEQILQKIKKSNNTLYKNSNLKQQFKLNKQMNELYRSYKQKMYLNTYQNPQKQQIQSQTHPHKLRKKTSNLSRHSIMQIENRQHNHKSSMPESNIIENQCFLEQIYISQKDINGNKEFMEKSLYYNQFISAYKNKISFKVNKYKKKVTRREANQQAKSVEVLNSGRSAEVENLESQEKAIKIKIREQEDEKERQQIRHSITNKIVTEAKLKKEEKQHFLTIYLDKKNRKYKKPWGNKILIKFDPKSVAKQMLGERHSKTNTALNSTAHSNIFQQVNRANSLKNSFLVNEQNMNQLSTQDKWVLQRMNQEKNDDKFYQTMCKNEKVNLHLKNSKKK